ncbi:MAG: MOP flippase family protein [bacterium]|nr:MOP flippase family protein [bacterium]
MSKFKNLVVSGIAWSIAAQVAKQLAGFIITIILVRLLTKEDFGLVAMITVFTRFALLFQELGFGAALIQNQEVDERHYSSVFWLSIGTGIVLMAVTLLAAPAISAFYNEPRLLSLVILISFDFLIGSFSVVQNALLNKQLEYRKLALIETAGLTISGGTAIVLALTGTGVYALVWQMLLHSFISVILTWKFTGWKPRFLFQWKAIKELLSFSLNLVGLQFFSYWVRNADNLLIGKFVGSSALGIYSRAYATMLMPLNQMTRIFNRVMFSALSKIHQDKKRVKSIYLRSIRAISLVTFPLMMGLAVVSESFVLALFGEKWQEVAPILQVLCAVGLIQCITSTAGWIFNSQGRADWNFRWSIVAGILTFIAFGIGIRWGAMGVAVAYLIRVYSTFYFHLTIPGKLIGMTFTEIMRSLSGVFLASLTMAAAVWGLRLTFPPGWASGLNLTLQVSAGVVIYGSIVHGFRLRAYEEVRQLIKEQWQSRIKNEQ